MSNAAVVPMPYSPTTVPREQIREIQLQLINEMTDVHMGALTAQYMPDDFTFEPGIGQIHFNVETSRKVCLDLAESVLKLVPIYPLVSPVKKQHDDYWFVGRLGLDPVSEPEPINMPTMEFYKRFLSLLHERDMKFVNSVAYEILNFFMPDEWKQLNWKGDPALSGWYPPSSFIQPTNKDALNFVSKAQCQILKECQNLGMELYFQIGEPWWWDGSYNTGEGKNAPCIYDPKTTALYKEETGNDVPTPWIKDIFAPVEEHQWPYVDWLCTKLGQSTNYIRDYVKGKFPDAQATLLFFTPQIMSPASELTGRLNFPESEWIFPNYDFVQIEDYDWIIDGRLDLVPLTFDAAVNRLGYPLNVVHYFIGFVLLPEDAKKIWADVDKAWGLALEAGIPHIYPWSYTQVMRDGVIYAVPKVCG